MTYIVEGLTAFLVKTLLRPKVYYLEPPKHRRKLDSPSLLIINHTSHLDGPVKILGPRATDQWHELRLHQRANRDVAAKDERFNGRVDEADLKRETLLDIICPNHTLCHQHTFLMEKSAEIFRYGFGYILIDINQ